MAEANMLSADEFGRSLSGAVQLLNRDEDGLRRFPVSIEAFWRSFGAVVLTAPAFVTALAADRLRLGLPLEEGLFSDPTHVTARLVLAGAAWIAFPILMIMVARWLGLGHRYVRFVIAYNWSAVLVSAILAFPTAMYVTGLASSALSTLFVVAFAIIVFRLRWFLAKAALGVSGGLAAVIAAADLALYGMFAALASAAVVAA
jgi:hypothetical protein